MSADRDERRLADRLRMIYETYPICMKDCPQCHERRNDLLAIADGIEKESITLSARLKEAASNVWALTGNLSDLCGQSEHDEVDAIGKEIDAIAIELDRWTTEKP